MELQNKNFIKGNLTITKSIKGVILNRVHETNKVVSSAGYGRNLIVRQLAGDTTYGIAVTSGAIGDDNTPATDSDTGLGNAVFSNITVEASTFSGDSCTFSFFILDSELPNGTYYEFGLFIGTQLLARAVFDTPYVKGASEDTRIDYSIQIL
jgi:hypothetical protein